MNRLITFSDGFCWWDVTDKAVHIYNTEVIELYVLYDDETESLIESKDELFEAINLKLPIAMQLGFIKTKPTFWNNCKRFLKDGYWYVKVSDLIKYI